LVPQHERRDDLAAIDFLLGARNDTFLDQVDDGVGEHLRVNAEISLVVKCRSDSARNGTDAELKCCFVGNQVGNECANPSLGFADSGLDMNVGRPIDCNAKVDAIDVEKAISVRSRHSWIDLGDDDSSAFHRREGDVDRRAKGAEAMRVRRRYVEKSDVDRDRPFAEKARDVGEKDRNVFRAPLIHRLARIGTDEEGAMMKMPLHRAIEMRRWPFGMKMNDANARHFLCSPGKRLEQRRGRRGRSLYEDLVAGLDMGKRPIGVDESHQTSHLSTSSLAAFVPSSAIRCVCPYFVS
jgi:hypothetical protein